MSKLMENLKIKAAVVTASILALSIGVVLGLQLISQYLERWMVSGILIAVTIYFFYSLVLSKLQWDRDIDKISNDLKVK